MKNRDEDLEFMRDLRAAILRGPRLSAHLLLFAMIGFLVLGVYWASRAPLDEVTRGMGQVIPSGKVQVVQNLEGGIVSEIRVREGNIVKKGQTLVLIDNTQFLSKYGEDRAKYLGLRAAVARLTAEEEGRVPTFPSDVMKERPQLARNEMGLYKARQDELRSAINVIKRQVDQKKQELVELASLIDNLKASFALAEEEFDITEPMVKRGVTPRIQLVRLMREISDLRTTMVAAQQSVPRAQSKPTSPSSQGSRAANRRTARPIPRRGADPKERGQGSIRGPRGTSEFGAGPPQPNGGPLTGQRHGQEA